jgi:hypothetical protein
MLNLLNGIGKVTFKITFTWLCFTISYIFITSTAIHTSITGLFFNLAIPDLETFATCQAAIRPATVLFPLAINYRMINGIMFNGTMYS